jgi:hypothetical protein
VLTTYEKASGAKINKAKSRIMALGNWDNSINKLDITYSAALSILGTQITPSIKLSCDLIWEKMANLIKALAQRDYARRLSFDARVRFIHEQLYAYVWYLAQRWNLINVEAKCRALFLQRVQYHLTHPNSLTSTWIGKWRLGLTGSNPPNLAGSPAKMGYLIKYHVDSAYIEQQSTQESRHMYKKRVYHIMLYYTQVKVDTPVMRIRRIGLTEDWGSVCENLHEAPIPEHHKAILYRVVRYIIRTNERLFNIRISSSERCRYCGNTDTLLHRFTSCG